MFGKNTGKKLILIAFVLLMIAFLWGAISNYYHRREYYYNSYPNQTVVVQHHSGFDGFALGWLLGHHTGYNRHYSRPIVVHHYHTRTVVLRPRVRATSIHINKTNTSRYSSYHATSYHSSYHSSFHSFGHAR